MSINNLTSVQVKSSQVLMSNLGSVPAFGYQNRRQGTADLYLPVDSMAGLSLKLWCGDPVPSLQPDHEAAVGF